MSAQIDFSLTPTYDRASSISRTLIAVLAVLLLHSASATAQNPWNSWHRFEGSSLGSSFDQRRLTTIPKLVQDPNIHPAMLKAGKIADGRAHSRSTLKCWRYVKTALLESGTVKSYPQTAYAKQAGRELVENYGFVKLPARSPSRAPLGSVLVYGGRGAGHVELRTSYGFVSDYRSRLPSTLPFIGAYARVGSSTRTAQTAVSTAPRS